MLIIFQVASESDVQAAIKATEDKFGKLDVLVNVAGISVAYKVFNRNKATSHKLNDFERVVRTNLIGTFNVTRLAVPLMCKNEPSENGQRGVVINTSSFSAFDGQMGQSAYAASKAGIAGMTLPLARDLSGEGIRVVSIAPGLFDTPLLQSLPPNVRTWLAHSIPFPERFGNPDEFAMLVESIVQNPMLNGETIRIDGAVRIQT